MVSHPKGPSQLIRCRTPRCDMSVLVQGAICLACQLDQGIPQPPLKSRYGRRSKIEKQRQEQLDRRIYG